MIKATRYAVTRLVLMGLALSGLLLLSIAQAGTLTTYFWNNTQGEKPIYVSYKIAYGFLGTYCTTSPDGVDQLIDPGWDNNKILLVGYGKNDFPKWGFVGIQSLPCYPTTLIYKVDKDVNGGKICDGQSQIDITFPRKDVIVTEDGCAVK